MIKNCVHLNFNGNAEQKTYFHISYLLIGAEFFKTKHQLHATISFPVSYGHVKSYERKNKKKICVH